MSKGSIFAREATGLVREFSWFDAFAITWNATIIFSLFIAAPAVGLFPETNPFLALVLLFIFAIFYSINFGWLAMSIPRSGGVYIFNTRILHPAIGFACDWLYMLMLTLSAATIFNIIVSWTLSWFLSSISLIQLASAVKEPAWIFIIGTIFVIIGALLNMFPRRYMSWFYKVTIGLSLIGAAIVIVILLSGLGKFPALFTAVTGVDYNSIIPLAIQNGFKTGFSWSATILTLAWLGPFWLGFGGIYIAGEVKDIKKSVLWATLWAQVALMISYIVFTGVNYIVTGYTWYNALSWLYDNAPDVYPLSVSPEIQNIATIIAPHPLVGPIIAFTMFFSMLSLVPVFHIWISRPTFTWAFDRLLPEKYTEVSEKFHTPIISIVITTIIIEIGLATSAFIGLFPVWLNLSWMGVIVILISSLSGILLPYKAKTIFEGAPGIARAKVAGVPLVSIGGAGTLFFTLLFIVSAALYPSINPLSVPQMLLIAVWFIVGLIIFYAIRSYRMKQGIDITLAYKEIPPE